MSDDKFAKDRERKEREIKRRYGVGKTEKNSDSKAKWKKIVAVLLTIVVVVGLFWMFKPWKRFIGGSGEGENQPAGENVLFAYEAQFWYRGSEHGEPLENLYLHFPAPNIDNGISVNQLSARGWALVFIDNENIPLTQITYDRSSDNTTIYQLKGDRTKELEVLQGPSLENTSVGPKLAYQLSELYPHERFDIYYYITVGSENADNLTLIEAVERTSAVYYLPGENKTIDLYFDIELVRSIGNQFQTVERFVRYYENGASSRYWLYPPVGL